MQPTKRRYPRGENPLFDRYYNQFFTQSIIINPGLTERFHSAAFTLSDEAGIKSKLVELTGNASGKFLDPNIDAFHEAQIPIIEYELAIITSQYQAAKEGRPIPMRQGINIGSLSGLAEEMYKLQAKLDVRHHEVYRLKQMLKEFDDKRERQHVKQMFYGGLQGSTYGNPVQTIDGQRCGFTGGILCIVDKHSPYNGLSVLDYRKRIVQPYQEARQNLIKEQSAKRMEDIRKFGETDVVVPELNVMLTIDDVPPWPENCINHIEQQKAKEAKLKNVPAK